MEKDDDGGRTLVVFDSLLAALDHRRTTLCCVRCGKTMQNGLFVKHIVRPKKGSNDEKHYCPFLKSYQGRAEDEEITINWWDVEQGVFPDREKRMYNKRKVEGAGKAPVSKKPKK